MKNRKLIYLFLILITVVLIILYRYNTSYISMREIPNFLEKQFNAHNVQIKNEKILNDKIILVFTYNRDESDNERMGFASFKINRFNVLSMETIMDSISNANGRVLSTTDRNNNKVIYSIFYGYISDGKPNKFKVKTNDSEFIEELQTNTFFIKEYIIEENGHVGIKPYLEVTN